MPGQQNLAMKKEERNKERNNFEEAVLFKILILELWVYFYSFFIVSDLCSLSESLLLFMVLISVCEHQPAPVSC